MTSVSQYTTNIDFMMTTRSKNELLELLRSEKLDMNEIDENGNTLLHLIVENENLSDEDITEVIESFLASCDINARNATNETPLHLASKSGKLAVARKLIALGAEVDCKNAGGHTPLHHAVYYHKNLKLVELLLQSEAHVNRKDKWGRRPLYYAATFKESIPMVPLLLKWGAYVNEYAFNESPFSRALKWRSFHNAREMLAYGADINGDVVVYTNVKLFLVEHWVKLKAVGLPSSEKYEALSWCRPYQRLYQECLREVETLKGTFINARTSIYMLLHMDFGRRCVYLCNEELHRLVQCPKLVEKFPRYFVQILANYRETVAWKKLLEPAKVAWFKLTEIRLPNICLERIFAYLRNEDLVCMIEYDENE